MLNETVNNPEPVNERANKHRTKNHSAVIKLKEADNHIEMMKRRFQYLQVRDQEYRSKTIMHQHKIMAHDSRRQSIKKERIQLQKSQRLRQQQIQKTRQKNLVLKEEIQKNLEAAREKVLEAKQRDYQMGRISLQKNEEIVKVIKEKDYEVKQEKRKQVNKMEQISKINVSRYKQTKYQDLLNQKATDCSRVLEVATSREKQLQKLARLEEQMIKKSSQSMQASQAMKNRLKEVLGDDRRFIKLPSIHNKTGNSSTRGSTGQTQIITI